MSGAQPPRRRMRLPGPPRRPRILGRPEQGWSSLLLMLGMLMLLGLSIADSRPLRLDADGAPVTSALVPLMLSAGLIGYLLARSPLGVVRAHLAGAAVAAVMLLLVAGAALGDGASPLPTSLEGVGARVSAVWLRLDADMERYLGAEAATPTVATFLVLAAICWTTAQFSAFSIFRYDRGGPAVMASGAVLFLNLGLGSLRPEAELLPVVPVLALFSALAMLLLMRLQLGHQRRHWSRRHIADTGEVSRLFLRSGMVFVLIAVLGASSLTAWATIDAQDIELGDLEEPMQDVGAELTRLLGIFGVQPQPEPALTPDDRWTVQDSWPEPDGIAFRADIVEGQLRRNYWWGWAHDRFDGRGWDRDEEDEVRLAANEPLPWPDDASAGGVHPATAAIEIVAQDEVPDLVRGMAFRLAEADTIDREVVASVVDAGGGIGDIRFEQPLERGERVVIESLVRDYSDDASSLTANELRDAEAVYPPWVSERYLQGTEDAISGPRVDRFAARVRRQADNPYDQAVRVQDELRGMRYTTDMGGVCEQGEPIPECVLREQRGFCQHYATTMTMVLRQLDIPARIITGYLPGELEDGTWIVPQAAFHNWVEAYFPDYGWVRFDPTPRGSDFGLTPTDLPDGPRVAPEPTPEPLPETTDDTDVVEEPDETLPPDETTFADGPTRDDPAGPLLLAGGLVVALIVLVAALLLFRFRRLAVADGSLAYRGIVSLASRLGYGPHPSQTEYEYAGSLSETIPSVREDLYVVAGARVETAYGQRRLDDRRRDSLRRAYARVRTALLRAWLRLRR